MTVARIRVGGQAAVWSFDGGLPLTQLAIHLTGIPTIPSPIPGITEFLVQNNFDVLQPQYPGSFDSENDFTPQNCCKTVQKWANLISKGETVDLKTGTPFKHAANISLLSCHSFGTYAGMNALLNGFDIELGIFFAPMFEFGTKSLDVGLKIDLHQHVKHIAQALPLTFRMPSSKYWEHFFCNESKFYPTVDSIKNDKKRLPIICIVGNNDPSLDIDKNKKYINKFCNYYSKRIELVDTIVVPGGKHSIASLMTSDTTKRLSLSLQQYILPTLRG